jgi:serine phosphatase RsbU (regulator of sigma subunit)
MRGLLLRRNKKIPVAIEPVASAFPSLKNAEIAAAFAGERSAGDFYDSIRVNPSRVLFGLLDVAGRREQNQEILSIAQNVFRETGTKLLAPADANESDAMTELCLALNRAIMDAAGGALSPAFAGCYNEDTGILSLLQLRPHACAGPSFSEISELGATGLPLGLFSLSTSKLASSLWSRLRPRARIPRGGGDRVQAPGVRPTAGRVRPQKRQLDRGPRGLSLHP